MARNITIPIALIGGLGAGLGHVYAAHKTYNNPEITLARLCRIYTGYDPSLGEFETAWLKRGLLPLILGGLVHKFVGGSPLNVNRALGRAGVPFIRI